MKTTEKTIQVPEINDLEMAFGEIKHLPAWDNIPDQFKNMNVITFWNKFVSIWFFGGLTKEIIDMILPKDGVDKNKALRAIAAILKSWEPKHEHKEAGAAYLMSEWFVEPKDGEKILNSRPKEQP